MVDTGDQCRCDRILDGAYDNCPVHDQPTDLLAKVEHVLTQCTENPK